MPLTAAQKDFLVRMILETQQMGEDPEQVIRQLVNALTDVKQEQAYDILRDRRVAFLETRRTKLQTVIDQVPPR
jgi:hypothetical protein